jgi:protein-S-isoprenylcysteine O-methyltransferase Ste14
MRNGALKYIITLLFQRILGLLMFLLGAGWTLNRAPLIYFLIYFASALIAAVIMYFINPKTLAERQKMKPDAPIWDKILLTIYWLLSFFVIYLIAGLEQNPLNNFALTVGGYLLFLVSSALTLWAIIVNQFLESTARIQTDRQQSVCQRGPYRLIRHPTYAAILIWCVAVGLIFQTLGTILCAVIIGIIIIIRTALEDRMLKLGLAGYAEYAQKVKYRLFPFLW